MEEIIMNPMRNIFKTYKGREFYEQLTKILKDKYKLNQQFYKQNKRTFIQVTPCKVAYYQHNINKQQYKLNGGQKKMNTYKNIGYYKGFNNRWYCSISYESFNTKLDVKKYIKLNKSKFA